MTLGEYIKEYMNEHKLSYREFAKRCDLTGGYISMLVNEKNPNSGKAPTPSLKTCRGVAKATGLTIDELLNMIDDSPVDIGVSSNGTLQKGKPIEFDELTEKEQRFAKTFSALTSANRHTLLVIAEALLRDQAENPDPSDRGPGK